MRSTLVHTTVVAILLGFTAQALANQGVFMIVKGDIEVHTKAGSKQKAKVGMKVNEGDTVSASKDSRAKIVMVDKNVLQISPESKVVIEKYKFDEAKDEKNVSLNVIYGKVRSTVNQKYDGDKNQFNVKTPSAVAGVRGTDFLVGYSNVTNSAKVVCFHGQVMVGSGIGVGGAINNPVAVNPGQFTVANKGAPPAPPIELPKTELASMHKDNDAESDGNNGKGNNGDREPSGDKKEKGDKNGQSPQAGDGGGTMTTPAEGGTRDPASAGGEMAMLPPPPPTEAGGMMPTSGGPDCATCFIPTMPITNFPPQLPPDLVGTGRTRLIINIGQ